MGISTIGGVVDTSLKPKITYKTRYSWSTTSGSANQGALTYRAADNCLYKLDNVDSTSQTFEKWNLSTNSATSLTRIYGTSNASPLSRPILVVGSDGNIYCNVNTSNTTSYAIGIHKYNVSTNTWSDTTVAGTTYSQWLVSLPPIPSHFTNSSDVLLLMGNFGASTTRTFGMANVTAGTRDDNYFAYDQSGTANIYAASYVYATEIRDGHDKNPTGIYFMEHPNWSTSITRDGIGSITYGYDNTNARSAAFAYTNIVSGPLSQRNNSYEMRSLTMGTTSNAYIMHPIIMESRYLLTGNQGGFAILDILNGNKYISPSVGRGGTAGSTNPVYISATKKLYIHQRDNYLYEYDVTFE